MNEAIALLDRGVVTTTTLGRARVSLCRTATGPGATVRVLSHSDEVLLSLNFVVDQDIPRLLEVRKRIPFGRRRTFDILVGKRICSTWQSFVLERGGFDARVSVLFGWATERTRLTWHRQLLPNLKQPGKWAPWLAVTAIAIALGVVEWRLLRGAYGDSQPSPSVAVDIGRSIAELLSGLAVVAALLFTWRSVRATERQLLDQRIASQEAARIANQAQLMDRFVRAIELLEAGRPAATMGAVYALSRIGRDSIEDHPAVANVLLAETRRLCGKQVHDAESAQTRRILFRALVQRHLGVETEMSARETYRFDLDLRGLHLEGVEEIGPYLRGARLSGVHLQGSVLRGAAFEGADLDHANLEDADLRYATFGPFKQTHNQSVLTTGTRPFKGLNLRGANLRGAVGLTRELLSESLIDARTVPPTDPPPTWWPDLVT
ncbi:MAG TPA: pentapeptide repeat-containing protein [Planctomycetota bacterium]|nr:pentapeptide repeat-containing protein [Planctomycetota bacterium]